MKDTYIVVELVLVGFQVLIWVLLLVQSVFGYHWIDIDHSPAAGPLTL